METFVVAFVAVYQISLRNRFMNKFSSFTPVTTHIQMKWVMEVLMATRPPSHHSKRWAMIFLLITSIVQPPMSREAPSSIPTLSVDTVSASTTKFSFF